FWSIRAADASAAAGAPASIDGEPLKDDALARDAAVRAAFEFLRTSSALRLRPAESLRFEPVTAIEGREIVLRDGLVLPGFEHPLPFAAGVDLPALARLARGGGDVESLIAAYH